MAELASKSPAELTKLFEEISGSGELKAEYERLEAEKKQAEEDQVFNHQKKKGLTQEKNNMKARRTPPPLLPLLWGAPRARRTLRHPRPRAGPATSRRPRAARGGV